MVAGQRVNTKVVFIAGAGHSGSTLLGLMLGAHQSIFHAGEASRSKTKKRAVCKLCGPGCVVWGGLAEDGEDLYETLSRRTRRAIVVDSSKSVSWMQRQIAELRDVVPLHLVVLVRDGRAVVNAHMRKSPEISVRDHAAWWVAHMRSTEELAVSFPGSVHRVRYEEFALWPERTLRLLTGFLDVVFEQAMLDPWDKDQHPVGGNDGTLSLLVRERASSESGDARVIQLNHKTRQWYSAHPRGIVLDLRWQRELSADALAVFEAIAGQTNRNYAWEGPEK